MKCGRIVCEQEGSGPCFACDTLVSVLYTSSFELIYNWKLWSQVCSNEEQIIFNGDTDKGSKLYEQLLMQEKPKVPKGLEEAINQRNKLLEFDKNT